MALPEAPGQGRPTAGPGTSSPRAPAQAGATCLPLLAQGRAALPLHRAHTPPCSEGWALGSGPGGGGQRLVRAPWLPGRTSCVPDGPGKDLPNPLLPPVVLPAEKAVGREGTGQIFSVADGERAASREGPRGPGRKHLNIDVGLCSCRPWGGRGRCRGP